MDNIDLTITIIAFKNYNLVEEAVKSIECKTTVNLRKRIFIVDNSDSEYKRSHSFYKDSAWKDVVLINAGKNLGFARANNLVLNKLDSNYHAIINPDVILLEDSFNKIIEYLNKNSNIGMVIPKIVDFDGNLQLDCRREPTVFDLFVHTLGEKIFKKRFRYHTMQEKNYNSTFKVPFGQGSFLVVRTSLFKLVNGFDERFFMYMEDADLCRRINKISCLEYFPNTTIKHRWKRESHKNLKLLLIHLESAFKYFRKWGFKFF